MSQQNHSGKSFEDRWLTAAEIKEKYGRFRDNKTLSKKRIKTRDRRRRSTPEK